MPKAGQQMGPQVDSQVVPQVGPHLKVHAGGGTKRAVSLSFAIVLTETERVEIRRASKCSLSTIARWAAATPVDLSNAARIAEAMDKLAIEYVEKPAGEKPSRRRLVTHASE